MTVTWALVLGSHGLTNKTKESKTMNQQLMKISIFSITWLFCFTTAVAHDVWLSAKWNAKKTQILVSPVVAETFPNGEQIKDMKRFNEPSVYFPDGRKLLFTGNPLDSTVLGSVPFSSSCIVSAAVKQREITYDQKIAWEYLTEEIGMSREEAAKIITPGVKEFTETYSRNLKTLVVPSDVAPYDSAVGLPLEIVLVSWKDTSPHLVTIQFRLLDNGMPAPGSPVRVLSNGKATIVKTDSLGSATAIIDPEHPVLLAYILLTKVDENRLKSVWTNLAIYRLGR